MLIVAAAVLLTAAAPVVLTAAAAALQTAALINTLAQRKRNCSIGAAAVLKTAAAAVVLMGVRWNTRVCLLLGAGALVNGFAPSHGSLRTGPSFGTEENSAMFFEGVADERAVYQQCSGVWNQRGFAAEPQHHKMELGKGYREKGGLALKVLLTIDAESVYKSLTSRDLKTPTEKTLLGHVCWIRELLQLRLIESLQWCDTRDMTADGHTKGCIERHLLLEAMNGNQVYKHDVKKYTPYRRQ